MACTKNIYVCILGRVLCTTSDPKKLGKRLEDDLDEKKIIED